MVEEGAAYVTSKNEQAQAAKPGTTDGTDSTDTTQVTQLTEGEPALPVAKKRKLSSYLRASREQQSDSQTDSSPQAACKAEIDRYIMAIKPDP